MHQVTLLQPLYGAENEISVKIRAEVQSAFILLLSARTPRFSSRLEVASLLHAIKWHALSTFSSMVLSILVAF